MIDGATLFAWFVMAVLFTIVVAMIVALGSLPGRIAKKRNHPHVDAINAASWIGLAMGGLGWPVALIWALIPFGHAVNGSSVAFQEVQPRETPPRSSDVEKLRRQIAHLEGEIDLLKKITRQTP